MKFAQAAHWVCAAISSLYLANADAWAETNSPACEYRNVSVDPAIADVSAGGREVAEPLRRTFLEMATEALPDLGLRVVRNPEEAFWTLTASSLVGPTSVGIFIELTGSIELQHHLYIVDLDPSGFPVRTEIGGNYYIDVVRNKRPEHYQGEVGRAVRLLWGSESKQVAALCGMSARLREEGWMGIRELRAELVRELKRARGERARAEQNKHLELNLEGALPQGTRSTAPRQSP
jgi:hypothetical protein